MQYLQNFNFNSQTLLKRSIMHRATQIEKSNKSLGKMFIIFQLNNPTAKYSIMLFLFVSLNAIHNFAANTMYLTRIHLLKNI